MLWEHLQNKDFYLFSRAPTKLLPLALVQKELSTSRRSFQPDLIWLESSVIPEWLQGADKHCYSNRWATSSTTHPRRCRQHVQPSTIFLFLLLLKLRLFVLKGRWLAECFYTLINSWKGLSLELFKADITELDGVWRTDGLTDGLMRVDFERRSWQRPIRPDEH